MELYWCLEWKDLVEALYRPIWSHLTYPKLSHNVIKTITGPCNRDRVGMVLIHGASLLSCSHIKCYQYQGRDVIWNKLLKKLKCINHRNKIYIEIDQCTIWKIWRACKDQRVYSNVCSSCLNVEALSLMNCQRVEKSNHYLIFQMFVYLGFLTIVFLQ